MSRGDQMLAQMTGPPCARCGLRGPHRCVTREDYIGNRPGDGPTFPEPMGGSLRNYQPDGIETIYYAAKRVGLSLDDLRSMLVRAGERPPMRKSQWKVKKETVDRVVAASGRAA